MSEAFDAAEGSGGDHTDNKLLAELRALAARLDPIPPEALAAARSAIGWRRMDAELAALTEDLAPDALTGTRSTGAPTLLTFESPDLTVEVEVLDEAAARRLVGQLVPPVRGDVEVRHGGGTARVEADDIGRFRADGVVPGPVSLRCSAGAHVVETDWFLV